MDQNQSPFGGPASPLGGQTPPPPQTPEVKLRTMESDVGSIEKTGGAAPTPEFVASPIFKAETTVQFPEEQPGTSGVVKTVIWIVIVLMALGLAGGAYYYLWPMFGGTLVEGLAPVALPEPPQPSKPTPPPPPLAPSHVSHFGFPNDIIPKVAISDYSLVSILSALQNEANNAGATGELREILLVDGDNQPIALSRFMATLMPEIVPNLENNLKEVFEDDFTTYLYFDDKGVWPGYSVKTKPNVDIDVVTLQDQLKGLETASFNHLFLTPPGDDQGFRTGTVKEIYTNRFTPLSQPGSSFNYGLFDDRLIINTSYGGLLKALELMGL